MKEAKRKKQAKKLRLTTPEHQSPFLVVEGVGGGLFLNILWNWGAALDVPVAEFVLMLAKAEPGSVVIGRRLDRREAQLLRDSRSNSDSETYSIMLPRDELRWARR